MKNTVYVVVIVLCLVLAVVIFLMTRSGGSGGIEDIKRGEKMIWVKCNNPKCGEAYQIDQRDYYEQIRDRMKVNPLSNQTPPLTCKKCGEPSVYRAEKCEKCGKIFLYGVSRGMPDRCPDCGYSATEASRKERLARRRQ